MRITSTRPGRAVAILSREVSSLFNANADWDAIHAETQSYRATLREWMREHPDVGSVEVFMSERSGGCMTDVMYRADIAPSSRLDEESA